MQIDRALLKQFDVPAPRYTSYPTALSFRELEPGELEAGMAGDGPLSLYFHLPFCRSLCWYCACTKVITRDQSKSADYLAQLEVELDQRMPFLQGRNVVQIHLGGGTPTFFLPDELRTLGKMIRARLSVAQDAEISVEIDPREVTREHIAALRDAGFNRASLGVQDHNPEVQKIIHREQPLEQTRQVVDWLREFGFSAINFDLIYGLPGQTSASFRETIADVIQMRPDRLAVYSYAHVPWAAPAQKLLERHPMPSADAKLELFAQAAEQFVNAGWTHIGMDHFALPDDALAIALETGNLRRNFQGYSTWKGTDIHGFGMSSISQTQTMYFQNARELDDWNAKLDGGASVVDRGITLTTEDHVRRDVIMAIMCSNRVEFDGFSRDHDVDFANHFTDELAELQTFAAQGLVKIDATGFRVTATGRFFVRNIAAIFDTYRQRQSGFSKAV
ncbi:MAG: oxygen-independent coproporphyrinogen III oxidase [bacterium]